MRIPALLLPVLLGLALPASAQNVGLAGVLGSKALLVVDGAAPKAVAAGESYKNVKVLSIQSDSARIEVGAHQFMVRLGEAPSGIEAQQQSEGGGRIVLNAGSGGHFVTSAQINGQAVQAMVDTGATAVALNTALADRIGLPYRKGRMSQANTANGMVPVWHTQLSSLRVGDVTLYAVDAMVTSGEMPFVLLGNSFLSRFQMTRTNDQMVLEKRF